MSKKIIAIPVIKGRLCASLGRCEKFAIIEVNNHKILKEYYIDPPEHQPGAYPRFLSGCGVNTVITGGMGDEAYRIFRENSIEVFIGMCLETPEELVNRYLMNELKKYANISEHLW